MSPITRGALAGVANVVVIVLGLSIGEHARLSAFSGNEGLIPVLIGGSFLGALLGMAIGIIAEATATWPIRGRRIALVGLAWLVCTFVVGAAGVTEYLAPALIPTAAAALHLERATRERPLPAARAL